MPGTYSFWFPFVYTNWILTDTTWMLRFRVITVQLMSVPLLLGSLVALCTISRQNTANLPWHLFEEAQRTADAELEQTERQQKRTRSHVATELKTIDPFEKDLIDWAPHSEHLATRLGAAMFVGTI